MDIFCTGSLTRARKIENIRDILFPRFRNFVSIAKLIGIRKQNTICRNVKNQKCIFLEFFNHTEFNIFGFLTDNLFCSFERFYRAILFAISWIWRKPTDHSSNCFSAWLTLPNFKLARMQLLSSIVPLLRALNSYVLFKRNSSSRQTRTAIQKGMKSLNLITEVQMTTESHTTPTKKTSTTQSVIMFSQNPVTSFFDVETQSMELLDESSRKLCEDCS